MSTRTNIIIQNDDCKIILYRHHDGYLSETGIDVYRTVEQFFKGDGYVPLTDLLNAFLGQSYEDGRAVYRVTDCIHGDIEHLYKVEVFRDFRYNSETFKDELFGSDCLIGYAKIDYKKREFSERMFLNFSLKGWGEYLDNPKGKESLTRGIYNGESN